MKKRHYLYLGLTAGFILGMFCGIIAARAAEHDASATMKIGARIIQCGTRYEALGQCKAGVQACCAFAPIEYTAPETLKEITPSAGKHYPDIDMHGVQVTTEESDTGTVVNFE